MIDNHPKVFISYCRQPEENLIRAQQLADRLTQNGVYVVIDLWDLKDGQDKNEYMEKMVTDPSVDKVLLICNKQYVEKANKRKGGVGIESTIISSELYEKTEQTKFIPVVFEVDNQGNAYLPVFAKSRIYVDLSSDEKFEDGFDQLLRDLYSKPRFDRPPLGEMPNYLKVDAPSYLKTAGRVNNIKVAIEKESKRTGVIIAEYIDSFFVALLEYKIEAQPDLNERKLVEVVEEGIESIQVLKNDFIGFLETIVQTEYCTSELFQDFFERLLQFYEDNDIQLLEDRYLQSYLSDNYRFFNYELFLSFVTIMIKHSHFDIVHNIVKYSFCIIPKYRYNQAEEQTYRRFQSFIGTLNKIKQGITNSNRFSITADTVKQYTTILKFEDLVASDILLYYLSLVFPGKTYLDLYWYPDLSVYNGFVELYPRLVSKRFFNKFKVLFNVDSPESFKELLSSIEEPNMRDGKHRIPSIKQGLCFDKVASID